MAEKCLTPNCKSQAAPASRYGLCLACHGKAKRLVESGMTTWQELEEMGLVAKPQDPFEAAFEKAKKGKDKF